MNVSMDRHGRVVVAGEGTYRVPMGAEETDNSLSAPVSAAQMLLEREHDEFATLAAVESLAQKQARLRAIQADREQAAAQDQEEYQREAEASANAGEHPLTYVAALQTMAGDSSEHYSPISGYLLSQDGVPSIDRTMNGHSPMQGLGDWLSDLQDVASSVQETTSNVSDAWSNVQEIVGGSHEQPPTPAVIVQQMPAPVTPAQVKAPSSSWMNKKVAGIPLPYAVGGGVLAVAVLALALRKK